MAFNVIHHFATEMTEHCHQNVCETCLQSLIAHVFGKQMSHLLKLTDKLQDCNSPTWSEVIIGGFRGVEQVKVWVEIDGYRAKQGEEGEEAGCQDSMNSAATARQGENGTPVKTNTTAELWMMGGDLKPCSDHSFTTMNWNFAMCVKELETGFQI